MVFDLALNFLVLAANDALAAATAGRARRDRARASARYSSPTTRSPCRRAELVDHLQACTTRSIRSAGSRSRAALVHLPIAFDDSQTQRGGRALRRTRSARTPRTQRAARTSTTSSATTDCATVTSCTRPCSRPSTGLRSSASFRGCRSCSRSTRADAIFVPKYNPTRTWTPEGAVGIGGPCYRDLPRRVRGRLPADRPQPAHLRRPCAKRGLPREPAAAPRRRPRQVPPGRPRRSSCSSSRTSTPTRYRYRIEDATFDVGAFLDWAADVADEAEERRRQERRGDAVP